MSGPVKTSDNPAPVQISKSAENPDRAVRRTFPFPNARSAFKAFLERSATGSRRAILLPSYIGWSAREGSGVFDPVAELKLPVQFYRVTRDLHVDVDDFEAALRQTDFAVVVLIHYFGFVDPAYHQLVRLARERGALIVEDEAHAMLTDLVTGGSGRLGDACLFSLHKMLPVKFGGLLVLNAGCPERFRAPYNSAEEHKISDFDLWSIAQTRRWNATRLAELLLGLENELTPLVPTVSAAIVPQTFPVVLKQAPRDQVYQLMNERGFGVVSLYHTLIPQLADPRFADAQWLSRRILNLPVHQDVNPARLAGLVRELEAVISQLH